MKQAKFDALEGVASAASVAALSEDLLEISEVTPTVTPNTILVDNAAGTARESKTFAEVQQLLKIPAAVASIAALKAVATPSPGDMRFLTAAALTTGTFPGSVTITASV